MAKSEERIIQEGINFRTKLEHENSVSDLKQVKSNCRSLHISKAKKDEATAEAAAEVSAVAAAGDASASYVQAELQAAVDLANDLKAKYDAMVVLVNEMQVILDKMNA